MVEREFFPFRFSESLLEYINHARGVLEKVKREVQAKKEFERGAKIATLNLPSDKASERIIRYETTIERRMHRPMEQLGRLQREWTGEPTPPPINVNVKKVNFAKRTQTESAFRSNLSFK